MPDGFKYFWLASIHPPDVEERADCLAYCPQLSADVYRTAAPTLDEWFELHSTTDRFGQPIPGKPYADFFRISEVTKETRGSYSVISFRHWQFGQYPARTIIFQVDNVVISLSQFYYGSESSITDMELVFDLMVNGALR